MITLAEVLEENPHNVNLLLNGVSAGEAGAVLLQQHISKTPELQLLELRGSTVGPGGAARIARALHDHPCIRHVGLARNGLDLSSTLELLGALATCRMLQSLDLEWCGLDDTAASVLAKWLSQLDCTLVALNLERNFIGRQGAAQLAAAVAQNTSLHNLNIGHMRCEAEAAAAWGQMLARNSTLLTLNMSGTELLTDSTKHVLLGLKRNRTLRALSLQYCQGLTALSEIGTDMAFAMCMKDLNMQGSRAAPNETGARGFASAIQRATGLIGLNISRCVVGEAAMVQMLAGGVSFVMSLQVFDVSACGLNDGSMAALAQVLDRCINLHTLSMDENHIGPRGAQILAENGLAKATALTSLSMSNCDARNAGIIAVALALRRKHITSLRVSNNAFDIDGGKALVQALLDDPAYNILRELDVSQNRLTARYAALLGLLFKRHPNLMPICVRGTSISQAAQEAYVDAVSIKVSSEASALAEEELAQQKQAAEAAAAAAAQQQAGAAGKGGSKAKEQRGGGKSQGEAASSPLSRDPQQQQLSRSSEDPSGTLATNFHGASPGTRALPPTVRSEMGLSAQAAIRRHKERGSWLDDEFGDTVNSILNATTNFRNSSGTYSFADTQYTPERNRQLTAVGSPASAVAAAATAAASSSSPLRVLGGTARAAALQGGALGSSTDPVGGLVGAAASRFKLQQPSGSPSAAAALGDGGAAVAAAAAAAASDGSAVAAVTGGLPSAARNAVQSLATKSGAPDAAPNAALAAASARELQRPRASAGGFMQVAGLAPRTEPSPMWARRPQLHDLEACVGEDLCVSEPQLKLLFMELDRDRTGLISRGEAESVFRKFCIEFDEQLDGPRMDRFFEKYLPEHFGGALAKAAQKRLKQQQQQQMGNSPDRNSWASASMVGKTADGGDASEETSASSSQKLGSPAAAASASGRANGVVAGAQQHALQNQRVVTFDVFSMLMLSLVNR